MSPTQSQSQCLSWELRRGRKSGLKTRRRGGKAWKLSLHAGGDGGRDESVGLQQLGGSRGGSRRPSLQPSILARGRDLWRALAPPPRSATRLCPTRPLARSSRHPYLQSRRGPPKFPQPPAGQQALTNKRPIRRRGSADEWTFRFQAWHSLGFPGVLGRAGRSHLPEQGHGWGQRVLKTPTSRSPRDGLGEVKTAAERLARERSRGPGAPAAPRPRNSALGHRRPPNAAGPLLLPPGLQLLGGSTHVNQKLIAGIRKAGLEKCAVTKKPPAVCQTPGRVVRCGNNNQTRAFSLDTHV